MVRPKLYLAEDFYRRGFYYSSVAFFAAFFALIALGIAVRYDKSVASNTNATYIATDILEIREASDEMQGMLIAQIEMRAEECLNGEDAKALSFALRTSVESREALVYAVESFKDDTPWTAKKLSVAIHRARMETAERKTDETRDSVKTAPMPGYLRGDPVKAAESFFGTPHAFQREGNFIYCQNLYGRFTGKYGKLQVFSVEVSVGEEALSEEECLEIALRFCEVQADMRRCKAGHTEMSGGIGWVEVTDAGGNGAKVGVTADVGKVCFFRRIPKGDDI